MGGLPAGLSVNQGTGLISGTPTASGTFDVTVNADNTAGTGSKTVTITIATAAPNVTEFSVGISPNAYPLGITAGPDGNIWFTEYSGNRIGRITPNGVVTEFSAGLSAHADPTDITAGPDGNLWFTEWGFDGSASTIGRITPTGIVTEFNVGSHPEGITTGPDGNLWVPQFDMIARVTPTGVVTFFPTNHSFEYPHCITTGSDGNLYYTETGYGFTSTIGRITPSGVITEFSTGIDCGGGFPCITAGPDGNIWFTGYNDNVIGRLTPAGVVTKFSAGISANAHPYGITAGPDGNIWFTEPGVNRIGRITPAGVVTEFSTSISAGASPTGITAGPDGNIWFTEPGINRIGRITISGNTMTYGLTVANGGNGIVSSSPSGINCGSQCSAYFSEGTQVILTATANTGYQFTGWSGALSGTLNPSNLIMTDSKAVTAGFSIIRYVLTVTKTGVGSGAVTSSPAGIDCGLDCSETYDYGT